MGFKIIYIILTSMLLVGESALADCKSAYETYISKQDAYSILHLEIEKPGSTTLGQWATRYEDVSGAWSTFIYWPMNITFFIEEKISFEEYKKFVLVLVLLKDIEAHGENSELIKEITQDLKDDGYNVSRSKVVEIVKTLDREEKFCQAEKVEQLKPTYSSDRDWYVQGIYSIDYLKMKIKGEVARLQSDNSLKGSISCIDLYRAYLNEHTRYKAKFETLASINKADNQANYMGLSMTAGILAPAEWGGAALAVVSSVGMLASRDLVAASSVQSHMKEKFRDTYASLRLLEQAVLGDGALLSDTLVDLREKGIHSTKKNFAKWLQVQNSNFSLCSDKIMNLEQIEQSYIKFKQEEDND